MRNSRTLLLVAAVVLLAAATASAGDFATLNFLGFSRDGRYLAFEEHGVQDGSGFPYSSIYFVDVAKNSFAAPAVHVRLENESATEQQSRSRSRTLAASVLRRLRIVERNTGTLIVSRLLTDVDLNTHLKDSPDEDERINFAEVIGSIYRRGDYDLILKPVAVKTKDCEYADSPVYTFELSLKDNTAKTTRTLQRDTALPASRSCPLDYAIQYVYLYDDFIAVFLNMYRIGFEGPDMRYLVVTGRYK